MDNEAARRELCESDADETCVRLLPANTYGWSRVGSKASQICPTKAAITGTLVVTMDATTPLYLHLIFEGETDACRSSQDGISDQVSGDPFCASPKHTVKSPKQFFHTSQRITGRRCPLSKTS